MCGQTMALGLAPPWTRSVAMVVTNLVVLRISHVYSEDTHRNKAIRHNSCKVLISSESAHSRPSVSVTVIRKDWKLHT